MDFSHPIVGQKRMTGAGQSRERQRKEEKCKEEQRKEEKGTWLIVCIAALSRAASAALFRGGLVLKGKRCLC
ncbi:hypothetical protein A8L45_21950 [Veronia pacifica]|uniref:Uncharacterized protein n=1 Tax=Veronia pacifica TaxID=1080227 RepID=A0A1C3E8Y0_9GAMM|nr:hypothetical protein A8L45_21950 [Veronia pacifica]